MSRHDRQRLADIRTSIEAIRSHLGRGELSDGLIFDAVRIRLLEIGESVKSVSPSLLASEPNIPWRQVAAMRDRLAHQYFDTSHSVVASTIGADLDELDAAVTRLLTRVP